jgi:biopolymer transport protein ExbB/TolQ
MSYQRLQQGLIRDVRKLFVLALSGGVLSVCIPQFFNTPLLAVVLPLLCMILYTWRGYLLSADSSFIEQFADSVYYLGFLLTLVALVVSLYFYQGDSLEASLLTANFSLALITTIFGLAVRIFINNFQVDLNSIERHVMSEVEHAANELIRKAKLISMQLDVAHEETQIAIQKSVAVAAKSMQEMTSVVDKYTEASAETLQKNTQLTTQSIRGAVTAFEKNIRNTKLPEDIFIEQLNPPLALLQQRLETTQLLLQEFNSNQSEITQSSQAISRNMTNSSGKMDILTQSISAFNEQLSANSQINTEFAQVVQEIALLAKQTQQISSNIEQQTEQSSLAMQNFSKLMDTVNTLPDDMATLSQKIKLSAEQIATAFRPIGEHTQSGIKISQDLQEISTALSHTRATVQQISDFSIHVTSAVKRVEMFDQQMEKHAQLLADIGDIAQQDLKLAKQHQLEMAEILQKSRSALALLQQDLIQNMQNANNSAAK